MMQRYRSLAAIIVALFAALTVACGAASTATPSPATSVPSPKKGQLENPTATSVPPTPVPTQTPTQAAENVDSGFIQLTDPLDEPQFYCVDVPGSGTAVRLNSPLQAHTCKPIDTAADELFTIDRPKAGQIYMEAYQLCLEAEEPGEGSSLRLQACSDSELQLFTVQDDIISLDSELQEGLCLAVDPDPGIPTGGPSHLRRALTLESCETTDHSLMRWSLGLFDY